MTTTRLVSGRSTVRTRYAARLRGLSQEPSRHSTVANQSAKGERLTPTLRARITRTLALNLGLALIPLAYLLTSSLGASSVVDAPINNPVSVSPSPAAALLAEHDCWTDDAPADVIPGHVVVTKADGETVYGGERLTSEALGQLFDGEAHGLTVHGFCE